MGRKQVAWPPKCLLQLLLFARHEACDLEALGRIHDTHTCTRRVLLVDGMVIPRDWCVMHIHVRMHILWEHSIARARAHTHTHKCYSEYTYIIYATTGGGYPNFAFFPLFPFFLIFSLFPEDKLDMSKYEGYPNYFEFFFCNVCYAAGTRTSQNNSAKACKACRWACKAFTSCNSSL